MNKKKFVAGLDAGHISTKSVIMREQEIAGYATVQTAFDVVTAAQTALNRALDMAGVSRNELERIIATGIFRDMIGVAPLNVTMTVPDYVADAKGALLLNKNSRTIIDMGGNIQKAVIYDEDGNVVDVIQNDKCADGLGIFYTSMAKALRVSEQELSELALKSTKNVSVDMHCTVSAQLEAFDLMCQGIDITDVAEAILRFIAERVASMCTCISLTREIVVAGGLARSKALIQQLSGLLQQDVIELKLPEYAGAIGAVISYEGEK
jgi:predicted CoA-substrate-specific enzyme activase